MSKQRDLFRRQIELQEEMQSKGLNLVTCGNCGSVNIHRTGPIFDDEANEFEIECCGCLETMDVSDCPDYFYQGMSEAD